MPRAPWIAIEQPPARVDVGETGPAAYGKANACNPLDSCTTTYCLPWCM
jgi:hypothetical protein